MGAPIGGWGVLGPAWCLRFHHALGAMGPSPRPPHCQWTPVLPVPHVLACTLHPYLFTLVILLVLSPNCALERGVLDGLPRVGSLGAEREIQVDAQVCDSQAWEYVWKCACVSLRVCRC